MDELSEEDKLKVARARRSKDSCHSPSRSLRCSPTTLANLSPSTRPSLDSRRSLMASTITCLRSLSTWSATSMSSLPRQKDLPLRPHNTVNKIKAHLWSFYFLCNFQLKT